MRRYESIFVVNPDLSEEEIQATINKFTGIITSQGGTLLKQDEWGRRRLAYKIGKFNQGYYVLNDFAGEPAGLAELDRNFKLDDRIIRYLNVKTGDNVNVEALQAEIAAKAKPVIKPQSETEENVPVEEAEAVQETGEAEE